MRSERRRGVGWLASALAVALLAGGCAGSVANDRRRSEPRPDLTSTTTTAVPATSVPTTAAPSTESPTTAAPTTAGSGQPTGIVVVEVIDGDTIEVTGGRRVRLIGIDTPERGQCGFGEAAAALTAMVGGRGAVLVAGARDDTDRYGRLLRYVEVDGLDVNLAMIESGWAISRYDSRDGYGRHAREDAYVAADVGVPPPADCSSPSSVPTTVAPVPSPGGPGTDPRFGSCAQAKANGSGPYVRGVDPEYGWYRDGDGDGVVCE